MPDPALDPEGIVYALLRGGRSAAVGLELQYLSRAGLADALGHIDGVGRIDRRKTDLLARAARDLQSPLVRPGRQGDGLVAGLDRLGLRGDVLRPDPRRDAGRLQLAVHIVDDIDHRPFGGAHLGQVHGDGLASGLGLGRHRELDVAFERGDRACGDALVKRCGREGRRRPLQRIAGLDLGLRHALHQADVLEVGGLEIGRHLGQSLAEALRHLCGFRSRQSLDARPIRQGAEAVQSLIKGEHLAIVAGRARQVQFDRTFVDDVSSRQGRPHQLAGLGRSRRRGRSPRRRGLGLLWLGCRRV